LKQLFYNSSFFVLLFIAVSSVTLIVYDWMARASTQNYIKIDGDGKDYYSYLTSAFITKDLAHLNPNTNFVVETPTGNINMHPVGVAVLQVPFFGLGYFAAYLTQQKLDGYSTPFQLAISFAALFYVLLGIFFIHKTLVNTGFDKKIIFTSLICLFFGTTLLNYTITEPSMSHVYSFSLISAFIYYNQKLSKQFSTRKVYALAFIFGLILLVRPVNVLTILLLPFFYNSFSEFKDQVKRFVNNKKAFFASTLIVAAIFSIQSIVWFIQTGQLFQSGYKGNGFYFLHPQIFSMLFGFKSGIFIYTPLFFLASAGIYFMYKNNRFKAGCLILFSLLLLYVFSSYWGWTYFDGIGTRTVVDFYALVAIGLCYVLTAVKMVKTKWIVGLLATICVCFNLIICYQYKEGIIPTNGMNFNKFEYVFLKTSSGYKGALGGCDDLEPYSKGFKQPFITYKNTFDTEKTHFYNYNKTEGGVAYKTDNLNIDSRKIHVKINLDRLEMVQNATKNVLMALSLNDIENNCKAWQTFKLNDVPSKINYSNWKHYNYGVNIIADITQTDKLSVFIWNVEKKQFGIDNFKIELYDYGHIN